MSDNAGGPAEVLVVEDDAEILSLVQRVLEEEGYQVTATSGLAEALGLLGEQRFGLMVTNLFPGRGQEPLESIEGLVAAAAIPVGVVTGWAVEEVWFARIIGATPPDNLRACLKANLLLPAVTRKPAL